MEIRDKDPFAKLKEKLANYEAFMNEKINRKEIIDKFK